MPARGEEEEDDADGWKKRRKISWARLIQKVFEVDPLLCPFRGNRLDVPSFTLDLGDMEKFLASIDIDHQEPEPPGHSPPSGELVLEPC